MNGSRAGSNQVSGFCVGVSIFCHLLEIIIWRVAKYISLLVYGGGAVAYVIALGSSCVMRVLGISCAVYMGLNGFMEKYGFIGTLIVGEQQPDQLKISTSYNILRNSRKKHYTL